MKKRKSDPAKPLCYGCKYRGTIPGDCHSCCRHPGVMSVVSPFTKALMIMFGTAVDEAPADVAPIAAEFEEHGIRNGWAMWPANFDPIWMKWCTGFKKAKA